MRCQKCGHPVAENEKTCPMCGVSTSQDYRTTETIQTENMYRKQRCHKCGNDISDKDDFCAYCGCKKGHYHSPDGILEFVRKAFRTWYAFILWCIIILSPIFWCSLGAGIGYSIGDDEGSAVGGVIGFIVGAVGGIVSVILGGGLIASFLELCENTKVIRDEQERKRRIQ